MGNHFSESQKSVQNPLPSSEQLAIRKLYETDLQSDIKVGVKFENFENVFGSSVLGDFPKYLYNRISKDNKIELRSLEELFQYTCRTTSINALEIVWTASGPGSAVNSDENDKLEDFFNLMIAISEYPRPTVSNTVGRSLSRHLRSYFQRLDKGDENVKKTISLECLASWSNNYSPCIHKVVVAYFTTTLLKYADSGLKRSNYFTPPILKEPSSIVDSTCLLPLAYYSNSMQGSWVRLFSSEINGSSFNRIAHHLLGYDGPCCLLIRSTTAAGEDAVFGAFTEHRWKDSNRFYGSASTFLFTLKPNFNVYRAKAGSNDAFQWLNLKASCSYSDLYLLDDLLQMQSYGLPHGLGFGGSTEKFRLFIPDTMETCSACASCLTFESGPLLPNSGIAEFQIDTLEIWACGGEESIGQGMKMQARDRSDRDQIIQQARKVDKAQFANSSFDQEFLLAKTFAHKTREAEDAGR